MDPVRVLYAEDNPADRELTVRHLARRAPHVKLTVVGTVADALAHLEVGDTDVVLADYRLPDATGEDLLARIKAKNIRVPVVLVTGSGDAAMAVRLLKAGAADYLVKSGDHLDTLPLVIESALRWYRSTSELRRVPIRILYAERETASINCTFYGTDGEHVLPANLVARGIGTVTSDLLCAVSARVPRIYLA